MLTSNEGGRGGGNLLKGLGQGKLCKVAMYWVINNLVSLCKGS